MLIVFCKTTHFSTLVKNKYIYVILSVLQIHLHMYLIKIPCNCAFGILNWFTWREQLIMYLMHFNCSEVVLKCNYRHTEGYLIVLKWNYCKCTLNILPKLSKDHIILINSYIKTHLGLIIRNMHRAQVVLQIKLNYNFISVRLEQYVNMLIYLNYT